MVENKFWESITRSTDKYAPKAHSHDMNRKYLITRSVEAYMMATDILTELVLLHFKLNLSLIKTPTCLPKKGLPEGFCSFGLPHALRDENVTLNYRIEEKKKGTRTIFIQCIIIQSALKL